MTWPAQNLHHLHFRDAFFSIDHQAVLPQSLKQLLKVDHVFLPTDIGNDDVVQVPETLRRPHNTLSMRCWKIVPGFFRPKDSCRNL